MILSYESQRSVLMNLNPNRRILLSMRCPELQTADKSVPLKIKKLEFLSNGVQLESTTYKLSIVQYYKNGKTPQEVKEKNKEGGVSHDVDAYGLFVETPIAQPTSNKIIIGNQNYEQNIVNAVNDWQQRKRPEYQQLLDDRKNMVTPPWTHYLQFKKTLKRSKIEQMEYTGKSLHDAFEYLLSVIFEGRPRVVVKTVKRPIGTLIRFPESTKIWATRAKAHDKHFLKPILDPRSFQSDTSEPSAKRGRLDE